MKSDDTGFLTGAWALGTHPLIVLPPSEKPQVPIQQCIVQEPALGNHHRPGWWALIGQVFPISATR